MHRMASKLLFAFGVAAQQSKQPAAMLRGRCVSPAIRHHSTQLEPCLVLPVVPGIQCKAAVQLVAQQVRHNSEDIHHCGTTQHAEA